jgi:hypothetical protein
MKNGGSAQAGPPFLRCRMLSSVLLISIGKADAACLPAQGDRAAERSLMMVTEKLHGFAAIVEQATKGELVFPSSVNAALRLQLSLADPECHIEEVLRLVLAEPVLAARTVALANSPTFHRSGSLLATSVRAAVMRVGHRNLYTLASAMVVRQFGARIRDPELRAKAEQLWRHSVHTAALSYQIARRVTGIDGDSALFAGIIHEAGGLYLLARADELPGLLDDPQEWMGAAEEIVTREVLRKLSIPEPVAAAIVALRGAALTLPPAGLRDTLLLAKQLAPVPSPMHGADATRAQGADTLAAFLGEHADVDGLLAAAAPEAEAMSAALLV